MSYRAPSILRKSPFLARCSAWLALCLIATAVSVAHAADESKLIQSYLAHEFAPASDKATMQTRAVVLAQHAKVQAELVAAFKADGSEASKRSFRDLQDRDAGLREELRSVEREWAVWQVQHGLRKQQDAELVYQRNAADC